MQGLLKKRLVEVMTVGAVLALSLPAVSRADLDVAAACASVGLADPVDRAAAAAALPTYGGVAQVCTVQALLATLGELPGSRTVDGRYDKQVRDALADFQRGSGLDATGLLNPETLSQLASDALDVIFAEPIAPAAPAATAEPAVVSDTPVAAEEDFSSTQVPAPRPATAGRDTTASTGTSTSTSTTTSTAAAVTTSEATTSQSAAAADGVATATDSSVVVTGSRLSASIGEQQQQQQRGEPDLVCRRSREPRRHHHFCGRLQLCCRRPRDHR